MRLLKLIIVSLLSLSFVICLISFFLPSHIRISRTIRIDSSSEAVMEELNDPQRWRDWYPGADSADFFYESGEIKGLVLNKHPRLVLVINEIMEYEIQGTYNKEPENQRLFTSLRVFPEPGFNHVTVHWYMDFYLSWYPWKKFASLMYDKIYGSLMDNGLVKLKKVVEAK